jgi:sec-independent protein translocase protein TatA
MAGLGVTELLIILAVLLLLFGAKKIPDLARSMGQGMKELKQGLREASAEEEAPAIAEAKAEAAPVERAEPAAKVSDPS